MPGAQSARTALLKESNSNGLEVGRIHELSVIFAVPHAVHDVQERGNAIKCDELLYSGSLAGSSTIIISTKWTGGWLIPAVPDENKCHTPIEGRDLLAMCFS